MAFRPSPLLTLRSAGVQPAFGSWVTAVSPTPGFAQAAYAPLTLTLGNAASSGNDASQMFKAGEDAWLINVDGSGAEQVRIAKVTNNTVILGPKTGISTTGRTNPFTEFAHAAGAIGTGNQRVAIRQSHRAVRSAGGGKLAHQSARRVIFAHGIQAIVRDEIISIVQSPRVAHEGMAAVCARRQEKHLLHDVAGGIDLQQPPGVTFADEGVAIGQPLTGEDFAG